MPGLNVDNFIGELPRISTQRIPDNAAVSARNCRLLSGNLRALNTPTADQSFSPVSYIPLFAYHLREANLKDNPDDPNAGPFNYPETWVPFEHKETSVVKGPVVRDRFERYYWSLGANGPPRYLARAELALMGEEFGFQELSGLLLGIPAPQTAPTVVPASTTTNDDTRSYVYTFVSAYGEEGPPSPPGTAIGDATAQWDLSNLEVSGDIPNIAERDIRFKRVYRVDTANTEFTFVAEIGINDTTYTDPAANDVSGNETLVSTTWIAPPDALDGLVEHPNGFLAGFSGFDIFFSEVFQPHAWPADYVVSVETPIVAIAVIETSLVVLTEGSPYVISGIAPDSMAITKIETPESCVSRFSVAVFPDGVYYASNNGIARVVAESVAVVTTNLVDSRTWRERFSPTTITACRDHEFYLAFYSADEGFFLTPNDPTNTIIFLDSFDGVENIYTDRLDGEVYYLRSGISFRWDPPNSTPITYQWKSKEFVFPKPVNLGAVKIDFDAAPKQVAPEATLEQQYNIARLADSTPLNPVNFGAFNASRYVPNILPDLPQLKLPIGGSSLFDIARQNTFTGSVRFIVFARDVELFSELLVSEDIRRLPGTVKTDKWQFELIGNTDIFYCKLADTPTQLAQI